MVPFTYIAHGLPNCAIAIRDRVLPDFLRVIIQAKWNGKMYQGREWFGMVQNNAGEYKDASEWFIVDPLFDPERVHKDFIKEDGKTYESTHPGVKQVNVIENMKRVGTPDKLHLPKKKVVVILGGGPSSKRVTQSHAFFELAKDPDVATIAVSDSLKYFAADYYVGIESSPAGPQRLTGSWCNDTTALLHIQADKHYIELPWKDCKFFCGFDGVDYGLSRMWTYVTVFTEAIQIATRFMGADHVVLVGFEGAAPEGLGYHEGEKPYPPDYTSKGIDGNYWDMSLPFQMVNMAIEVGAWLIGMHGVKTWNCSEGGVLVSNMFLSDVGRFYKWFCEEGRKAPRDIPKEIQGAF